MHQLCGTVTWLKPFWPIPDQEMQHLFSLLEGPSSATSLFRFMTKAKELLKKVVTRLETDSLEQHCSFKPLLAIILRDVNGILGALWQGPQVVTRRTYNWEPDKSFCLFALLAETLTVPLDSISFQEMVTRFPRALDNHLPQDKWLSLLPLLPFIIKPYSTPSSPVVETILVFSNSNNLRYGIMIHHPNKEVLLNSGSVQLESKWW